MPKASILQAAFNAGEISPLFYGRTDQPRYKQGLGTALNVLPALQGPLFRRPGTKQVVAVKDSTNPPVLIPFNFSATQAYQLEFGDGYIRFYTPTGQVLTSGTSYKVSGVHLAGMNFYGTRANLNPQANETILSDTSVANGSILELQSPYAVADVPKLKFTQDADTIYITHPSYPLYKLQRFGPTYWTIKQVYFQDGPYLPLNSYETLGDSTNITLSVIASPANIGVPYGEVQSGPSFNISGAVTDPGGSGQIYLTVTGHNFQNGQNIFVIGVGGTTEANCYDIITSHLSGPAAWPVTVVDANHVLLVGSTFTHSYTSGGTAQLALFANSMAEQIIAGPGIFADTWRNIAVSIGGIRFWGVIPFLGRDVAVFNNASRAYVLMNGAWPTALFTVTQANANVGDVYSIPLTPSGTADMIVSNSILEGTQLYVGLGAGETFASSGTMTLVTGTGQASITYSAVQSISLADGWYLGAFGFYNQNNFPACCTFHQDRLALAGAPLQPQDVNASMTSQYEVFSPSDPTTENVNDDNALQFTLASHDANVIRWLSSNAQGLLAGSFVSEWVMSPSTASEALTPTNFSAQQTSFFGSADAMPVQLGNASIYIQRSNRKVREMNYFFQVGTFRSIDMTELSEHITLPGVTKLAVQRETQPLVWAIREDGNLVSMVYNREDLVLTAGWTRHILGGQSDSAGTNPIVHSISVIPSENVDFDQLWLVVGRYINGSLTYFIEQMTKIFDDSVLQEDAFQLDCGSTYDAPVTISGITNADPAVVTANSHGFSNGDQVRIEQVVGLVTITTDDIGNKVIESLVNGGIFTVAGVTTNTFELQDSQGNNIDSTSFSAYVSGGQVRKMVTTISGLTWLEGETVNVLADGAEHPACVVSNSGVITLSYPAAKVQVGYGYNSDVQLLRLDAGSATGSAIGQTRRTARSAIQMHRAGEMLMGTDFKDMLPAKFFQQADVLQADEAPPLFSGIERDGVVSGYDFESQLCFRQRSPLPGTFVSVTSFMEEFDV